MKKGQELKVTKKDKKVTLSGDGKSKDITFSTKNDSKDKFKMTSGIAIPDFFMSLRGENRVISE